MIGIIDYGVGNLFSIRCSLEYIGAECVITGDADVLRSCERLILPGVGAFGDAAGLLASSGLDKVIISEAGKGKPLLGICLGMQLLYESSGEYGYHKGLGLLSGDVRGLADDLGTERLKVPHMGWNDIRFTGESSLVKYLKGGEFVYYVHSFYAPVSDSTLAYSEYGDAKITGIACSGNVMGCQFHPEKSGEVGLDILRGFIEYAAS